MKLTELLRNQLLIVQLCWGERKIEFTSAVLDRDEESVFVTPYMHGGSELQLNVTKDKDVVCNLFTDEPVTKQRISWKNVELTTVTRNNKTVYCLKTYGFNNVASPDDRRRNGRIIVHADGQVYDGSSDSGLDVTIYDISDVGISFYAQKFTSKSQQLVITFSDDVDTKTFNVRVECVITRMSVENGQQFVGCRIVGENRDYQLYCFMKHLLDRNRGRIKASESGDEKTENNTENVVDAKSEGENTTSATNEDGNIIENKGEEEIAGAGDVKSEE